MSVDSTAYQKWTCDRCQTAAYVPGQSAAYGWAQATRVNVNNISSGIVLCPNCYEKYKKLVAEEDQKFNEFLTQPQQQPATVNGGN